MSLGIVLMIEADLGGAPWDVFHLGLSNHFGFSVGTWTILAGFCIIALTSLLTKRLPKMGAFLNMLLVGVFIDLFRLIIHTPLTLVGQLLMLCFGLIVIGSGIGLYIAPDCGAGPRDSLMMAITERTGYKVQYVRGIMEVFVLVMGWLLGGPVHIGTFIFCLTIGHIVGFTLPQCQKVVKVLMERGMNNENIYKGTLRTNDHDGLSKKAR
ncbi:MAG: YitT family protein [Bacillaceae bacterium]|nr:YitT family protein [Bacillaceae bacterium]